MTRMTNDTAIKRDQIEHAEAEDGSWWYDLHSDGSIRQGGIVDIQNVEYGMSVTVYLPKSISQMINPYAGPCGSQDDAVGVIVTSWTENSITITVAKEGNNLNRPMQCFWIVEAMI